MKKYIVLAIGVFFCMASGVAQTSHPQAIPMCDRGTNFIQVVLNTTSTRTGVFVKKVLGNFTTDGAVYTPIGPYNQGFCFEGVTPNLQRTFHTLPVCDDVNSDGAVLVPFFRVVVLDEAGLNIVSLQYDRVGNIYTPVGPVVPDCEPTIIDLNRRVILDSPGIWTLPNKVTSVSYYIKKIGDPLAPPRFTDDANTVTDLEFNTVEVWPGNPFVNPFSISTLAGDEIIINYQVRQ